MAWFPFISILEDSIEDSMLEGTQILGMISNQDVEFFFVFVFKRGNNFMDFKCDIFLPSLLQ